MTTASERLRAKLDLAFPAVEAHAACLWGGADIRDLYPRYLTTMHMIVRAAVPLMETALDQARARAATEGVAAGLVEYLSHHIPEEVGHDRWLLEDLEATGRDRQEALREIPSSAVAELVGAQYYWLRHHHPVSILGHIAAIEGYHPPGGFARRLETATGYPERAFRAIQLHERLDIRHKQELYEMLDALPLTPEHETAVGISGLHTMLGIINVIEEIRTHTAPPPRAANAVLVPPRSKERR